MNGDNPQQARFYGLLEPELARLQAFCQKLAGEAERGDDLLQDALYDAWRGFGQLREVTAFKPWLYQIVLNRYRTSLRQFKKRDEQTVSLLDDIADDRHACAQAARRRLEIAMANLSARDRALVTLRELEGWSYAELETIFGHSPQALRTRLTRCRSRMRKALLRHLKRADGKTLMSGVLNKCVVVKQEES